MCSYTHPHAYHVLIHTDLVATGTSTPVEGLTHLISDLETPSVEPSPLQPRVRKLADPPLSSGRSQGRGAQQVTREVPARKVRGTHLVCAAVCNTQLPFVSALKDVCCSVCLWYGYGVVQRLGHHVGYICENAG